VDFTFSEEQEAFRASVRKLLRDFAPPAYVREMLEHDAGCTSSFWETISDLGWTGLLVPAAHGGAGFGLLDAVIVCEESGRLPLPGPWLSSAVTGALAATHLGDVETLPGLADGSLRATLALEETGTRDPLDPNGIGTTADAQGRLTGAKPLVLDGHTADVLYVVARDASDGAIATYAVERTAPGVSTQLVPTMDVTRKAARVVLDAAPARRIGPPGDQTPVLRRVVDDLGIALCAESVGACERALQMATDYAKARVQFGRPIATFQVIKHKIVDMLHQLELARVATHYAGWASTVDDPAREASAAMAKGFVAEAAAMITGQSIQVHGGVGFTWDVDCHLLFRRVKANDVLFGRQAWQRQRLADLILGPAPSSGTPAAT
jgi:alkylation response protein AidB-like acyl-CoA dehydrogenase